MKTPAPEAKNYKSVEEYLAALALWNKANTTPEQAAKTDSDLEDERFDQAIEDCE